MPRYYFNLIDASPAIDDEGIELPDVATARERALQAARAVIAAEVMDGRVPLSPRIEVEDEDHRPGVDAAVSIRRSRGLRRSGGRFS